MQPGVEKAYYYLRNSKHLITKIQNIKINETEIISLDIKSLYPSIPAKEAIVKITQEKEFSTHLIKLAKD